MNVFESINPFTQERIASYPTLNANQLTAALDRAAFFYDAWSASSVEQRADVLLSVASILRRDQQKLATLITREMGKVLAESAAEIEKCAWVCEYYAEHAAGFLQNEIISSDYSQSFVQYRPTGAVFAIMPWNFPFWQVFRFAAPTLMAGNVVLLKHAPNVTGCSLAIAHLFEEAAAGMHIFQSLVFDVPLVEQVISNAIVQGVTVTGSEEAGKSVAAIAGKHIKKSVMELGGSDAFIVLGDADMRQAAKVATMSRMQNAGQSCIAAKRFIVVRQAADDFISAMESEIKSIPQGDPTSPEIKMGPMARPDLAEKVMKQLRLSVTAGARIQCGGELSGCNFQPTLLLNVNPGMPAFEEEVFGPVAAVIVVSDEARAIELANASRFGLGASVWTRDIDRAAKLTQKIHSGAVYINAMVKSDPRLPFGGIKKSGYGRELGRHGFLEFMNGQTVAIQ